jgi:hypothetical protein
MPCEEVPLVTDESEDLEDDVLRTRFSVSLVMM